MAALDDVVGRGYVDPERAWASPAAAAADC